MIWRLCVCYVDVMWMIWIHTVEFPHVHIYILDESLSYPVSSPIATVLNSMHCFIYVSHGPNQDYYATENCLITQGDKNTYDKIRLKMLLTCFKNLQEDTLLNPPW